jgi:hypothetical protein
MTRPRLILIALAACASLAAAGCGDDDGGGGDATDPATMKSNFDEKAQAAYDAAGSDRDEDSTRGVVLNENCFILDQEGADAIAQALGVGSVEIAASSFLAGAPGEEESVSCTLVDDKGVGFANAIAGTTQASPESISREGPLIKRIKGDAPGLDPEDVAAVDAAFARRFAWISDGFVVSINGPRKGLEDETKGFEALSVAVDEVARTLDSD